MQSVPSEPTESIVYHKALTLLALREHSRHELVRKLQRHYPEAPALIDAVLERLVLADYVNDERFANMVVRLSVARGQGPFKIQATLREKGVQQTLAQQALAAADADWMQLASDLRRRKFGDALPKDMRERARQSRFLAGRGFYLETINAVFHEKC